MDADYYGLLGLNREATPEEIRNAYFEAARRFHPDANPDPLAKEQFLRVQQAYEILIHPQRRAVYDTSLPEIVRPEIEVAIYYSRPAIPRLKEDQLIYVLLELRCTAVLDPKQIPPLHLVISVDRSTSMQGERMDMVKANLLQLLRQLRPQDVFSVVIFGDRAEVLIPPTEVSRLGAMVDQISMIRTGGGTEMYQGLQMAAEQVIQWGGGEAASHLILITDGHTYGDEDACYALAEQLARERVVLSALGIGSEWNDAFLDRLTGITGGNTFFASAAQDLYRLLDQRLRGANAVYARGMTLEMIWDAEVKPRQIFRLQPDVGPLPIGPSIRLGNLGFGKNMSLLFEFSVSGLEEQQQIRLANGRIDMRVMTPKLENPQLRIDFRRPVMDEFEQDLPPGAILDAMARLTLYRMQEKARQDVASGDIINATRRLQQMATHLLSQGNHDLARTVLKEAEHLQQSHHFSKDGDKRIKYGTRALLLPAGMEQNKQ